MATLVKFLVNDKNKDFPPDVFAYFPELNYNEKLYGHLLKQSYSIIGQHSSCELTYARQSRPATESEYADLKQELESIGYNLKICK